jgi:hypothetical protein
MERSFLFRIAVFCRRDGPAIRVSRPIARHVLSSVIRRRSVDNELTPRDEEIEALDRIARTRDGMLLHRYLRRILEGVSPSQTEVGPLRAREGARILARDLMAHMAAGIEGTVERADVSILRSSGKPAVGHAPRGIRRRVAPDPDVAAYLDRNYYNSGSDSA